MSAIKKVIAGSHGQFDTTGSTNTSANSEVDQTPNTRHPNGAGDAQILREGDTTIKSTATTGDIRLDDKAKKSH